jgi:iron complex outermembrane receptor protein
MYKILPLFFLSIATAHAAETIKELDTVLVSTPFPVSRSASATPVTVLQEDTLRTKIAGTIGATLQNELGIHNQSFGAGVGSPVIRGQSGPRVQVLQNSMGNNDVSSLSPDHANGVEPILAERIEVFRGPATLLYGNGAIGGIVNVIDNRIPEHLFDKVLGGAGEQRYDSTTNETSSALKLEGSHKAFSYHVDGFYRDQGNTHIKGVAIDEAAIQSIEPNFIAVDNPVGVINNTQARSRGGSVGASLQGDIGLVGVSLNQLEKHYGIAANGSGNPPVSVDLTQTKYDFKAQLNKPLAFIEKAKLKFGYTDYQHTELDGGTPATQFTNQSYSSRLELEHTPFCALTGSWGFQSNNSQFAANNADGSAPLVPRSNIDSYGLFAVESLKAGDVTYQAGVRGEWVTITPKNHASLNYTPISGSLSALWAVNKQHSVSLAYIHSQRAPLIQELFYDGVHEASRSYELGDANLGKEFSNNLDLGYHFNSNWMSAEVNLFHNWVSNYIYQGRAGYEYNTTIGAFEDLCALGDSCIPVELSQQAGATFKGYEAQLKFPLMTNHYGAVDLSLFSDYTRGTFNKGGDVPRMPPLRYGMQLSYEQGDFSTNVRLTQNEAQNHAGLYQTNTPSYVLLNLGAQYHLTNIAKADILLFANGKNLLNENIRNATSYLRNFAPEAGRSGEVGIRVSY